MCDPDDGLYSKKTCIDDSNPIDYQLQYDWYGPQFWSPSHCIKTFSWYRPRTASPILAFIGQQNDFYDQISTYYMNLKRI